jgi:transketolase
LPGHPDIGTPGVVTNTGSLGMGISKAKGMVLANRRLKKSGRVFVLLGDGELQEGQIWESLTSAVNFGLHEIVAIIDHNKLQSDTFIKNVSDLGDLEAKFRAFGWCVERCDGHDYAAFSCVLAKTSGDPRPKIIIADTVKGKGVSFMEHTSLDSDVAMYRFHSGAPDAGSYQRAVTEISARVQKRMQKVGLPPLVFEINQRETSLGVPPSAQRLIPAYTQALLEQANKHPELVVLDADLVLDTGLIPFRDKYPDRFFECGIAEQDMVSVAGGMALKGLLPIVHSFACFLSARPNEQIYNNATEKTRVIYVGSLAGVVPGGPGHSHQAVRDISSLAAIPGMTLMEPSCEAEVGLLLDWCIREAPGSSYLRLLSIPWKIPYQLNPDYQPVVGQGAILLEGTDVAIIGYGPISLTTAFEAAAILRKKKINAKIINLPWLNNVDGKWLKNALKDCKKTISLDNHFITGGQGVIIGRALAESRIKTKFRSLGINEIPASGTTNEVLKNTNLNPTQITKTILKL